MVTIDESLNLTVNDPSKTSAPFLTNPEFSNKGEFGGLRFFPDSTYERISVKKAGTFDLTYNAASGLTFTAQSTFSLATSNVLVSSFSDTSFTLTVTAVQGEDKQMIAYKIFTSGGTIDDPSIAIEPPTI